MVEGAALLAWFIPITFEHPQRLWLLPAAVVLTFWLSRRSLAGLSPVRWWAANVIRVLVHTLLIFALAGAQFNREHDQLAVIYLADITRSVPQAQKRAAWEFMRRSARDVPVNDRVGVVAFDGQSYIEQLPQKPGPDGGLHIDKLAPPMQPDRSNLAQAVRMAAALFPQDAARRLVLLSDGNETEGDVLSEIRTAVANGVSVDVVPLRYRHAREVMFEKMIAPAYASLNDQVPLRLLLRSETQTRGNIVLYHDGQVVDLDPNTPGPGQAVELLPGVNPYTIRLPLNHAGSHRFEARFEPADASADEIAANNIATAFTNVEGAATVLYIRHGDDDKHRPADDLPLVEALRAENINVSVVRAAEAELDPIGLQQFSAIVLANVAADELTETQHKALASYVRDVGGGLVMLGGDDSFGAGGWQGSVVEAVMPVRFDVDEMKQIPRGALVVMMHACEMPQGNFWGVEVAIAALKTLSRLDYFGLVDWGGGGYQWAVPLRLADDKKGIERRIRQMNNSDMPDYHTPMDMAYKGLRARSDAAQKHVIVISDGDASPPTPGLIARFRGAKITVSTVSIFPHGMMEIGTLKKIAAETGGRYYDLSRAGDEKKLPQIFIKEAKIVRRPLIREEPFRPRVKSVLSEVMDGIGREIPGLTGYVVTTPRAASEIEMPLVSDKGDPVLAHWQCGLGRAVAFTSGWWTHWGRDWTTWPQFGKLWAQTVRWCMSQGNAADFEVMTRVEGERGRVVIEALNKDTPYLNFLNVDGVVLGPGGDPQRITLRQTGPSRYEADFDAREAGSYLLNVRAAGGEGVKPALIRTGVSVAYSREYRELEANDSLLQRIVDQSPTGRMFDAADESAKIFEHNLPKTISRVAIWNLMLQLAVGAFLIDVAVRRIAVDPRAIAKRARAFIYDLAGRFAPGRRAEAVLGDLKAARERVREEKTAAGDARAGADAGTGGTGIPVADRSRRFEASADALRKPAADLRESLGGAGQATPAEPPSPAQRAPGDKPAGPSESTTERLLKSKRRARGDDKPPQ